MTKAKVKWFSDEEGWGVLVSDELDGDVFVHFSSIEGSGYRTLEEGERVTIEWQQPGQDGCEFRATKVIRAMT